MNPDLWRTRPWLALASLLPVVAGAAWFAFGLTRGPAFRRVAAPATWLATRVAFAVLLWGVLGHAGTDQLGFFLPQAKQALAGALPYRDFPSAYAPLFAPLLALAVRLGGDVGPFALFLLADGIAWLVLARARGLSDGAVWMFAAWPPIWYLAVRYAQDEPLGAMFLALAWAASRRDRWGWTGALLGLGLVVTKPLFALPACALALTPQVRWRPLLLGAALPVAATYGAFLAWGAPVWQPLLLEGGSFGVGPTLWRLPTVFLGFDPGATGWLPFLVVALYGAVRLRRAGADGASHAAWSYCAFALLAPKFMPMYVILWAPLLAIAAAEPSPVFSRPWLVAYAVALPCAWVADSGPLQGLFGTGPRVLALVLILLVPLMLLAPMATLMARTRRRRTEST